LIALSLAALADARPRFLVIPMEDIEFVGEQSVGEKTPVLFSFTVHF